jgi:hypothetical protein
MRFKEFKVVDRILTNPIKIEEQLIKYNLQWLVNSEIEDAVVEIKNNTLIWKDGNFYAGNWHYGIWQNGHFHGIWENGIWENGNFNGKWKSGIKK